MRYLIIFMAIFLFGYEAKVEPNAVFNIKSTVNGEVVFANKALEAKNVKNKVIIKINNKVERAELKNIQNQIKILKEEIKNQESIVKKKKELFKRYKTLKSKSLEQKNIKFYDYINSKNQLLNLKSQLSSLLSQEIKLKDIINRKNIKFNGYLYTILVEKGDYATIGRDIALGYDLSRQKLEIYVPIDKVDEIKNKIIYINNKKSNFKISKIYKVTDPKYITSYKIELTGNGLKFGDIVKIEFKTK